MVRLLPHCQVSAGQVQEHAQPQKKQGRDQQKQMEQKLETRQQGQLKGVNTALKTWGARLSQHRPRQEMQGCNPRQVPIVEQQHAQV